MFSRHLKLAYCAAIALAIGLTLAPLGEDRPSASAAADPNALAPKLVVTACGNGFSAVKIERPAGFDAMKATAAQLRSNFLPPRPSGGQLLNQWKTFVTNPIKSSATCAALKPVTGPNPGGPSLPPTTTIPGTSSAAGTSLNWAGTIASGQKSDPTVPYRGAEGTWIVPSVSGPAGAMSSQWVGLGLGTSAKEPLYQDGTLVNTDGTRNLFFEVYPQEAEQLVLAYLTKPDQIDAQVDVSGNLAQFLFHDYGTGDDYMFNWTGYVDQPHTAEWIDERPTINGNTLPPFAINTTSFGSLGANIGYGYNAPFESTLSTDNMYDCAGTLLASTGGLVQGYSFTVTGKSAGTTDRSGC